MTLYLFYKKSPEGFVNDPVLYAFTNNKDVANKFRNDRNMDKFVFHKETGVSKDEFNRFSSQYHKCELINGHFYTKGDILNKRVPVSVLCTCKEEETVLINSDKMWNEYKDCLFDASMIKNKYLKALNTLMYFKFYGFFELKSKYDVDDFYEPYYSAYGPSADFILGEMQNGYQYDDLKLFLHFFGDTFK